MIILVVRVFATEIKYYLYHIMSRFHPTIMTYYCCYGVCVNGHKSLWEGRLFLEGAESRACNARIKGTDLFLRSSD